jgi:hypothetical protein
MPPHPGPLSKTKTVCSMQDAKCFSSQTMNSGQSKKQSKSFLHNMFLFEVRARGSFQKKTLPNYFSLHLHNISYIFYIAYTCYVNFIYITYINCVSLLSFASLTFAEGSLEAKFPTIWTDGNAEVGSVREEKGRRKKSK